MTHVLVQQKLVKTILENALKFDWTLQGFGMLRLRIDSNTRLHVWHSHFAFPNVSMIHDHLQWGFESAIIAGRLLNETYILDKGGSPTHMMAVLKPGEGCYFKEEPRPVCLRENTLQIYVPGDTYAQQPDQIHWSKPMDGTVTLMRKFPTADESARVFWPVGQEWGTAEPRKATPEEVATITALALEAWFKEV